MLRLRMATDQPKLSRANKEKFVILRAAESGPKDPSSISTEHIPFAAFFLCILNLLCFLSLLSQCCSSAVNRLIIAACNVAPTPLSFAQRSAYQSSLAAQSVKQSFPSSKPDVILSGTLSTGKSFERDIGHGLIFRLVPSPASYGKGWDIEIRPKGDPAGGFDEYASVATPPYH